MALPSPVPPPVIRMRLGLRRSLRNIRACSGVLGDRVDCRNDRLYGCGAANHTVETFSMRGESSGKAIELRSMDSRRLSPHFVATAGGFLHVWGELRFALQRDAEAVGGVVEVRRDAGAGGAAGDFDVMTPGTSAGGLALRASRAGFGAARIAIGGSGVEIGIIPVAAPLVDVVAHVIEAEIVGGVAGDRLGFRVALRGGIGEGLR